jgi:hypothetical protein
VRVFVAGGLGIEREALRALQGHAIRLAWSEYDTGAERGKLQPSVNYDLLNEPVSHEHAEMFRDNELFVDISGSRKSCYTLNDIAVRDGKRAVLLDYFGGWRLVHVAPEEPCLACIARYERPLPGILLPPPPAEAVCRALSAWADNHSMESKVLDLTSGEEFPIEPNPDCPAHSGEFSFLLGRHADVVAVSCGDRNVAVSPMDPVTLDLKAHRELLAPHVKIVRETPFFFEFETAQFSVTLFRQGRIIVKGSKERNTGMWAYRRFVGA